MIRRGFWTSRFVVVPVVIAAFVLGWNIYVSLHDNGLIAGQVVDASGHAVKGATVILFEKDFINQIERARVTTDADGRFRFTRNASHLIQLEARDGSEHSPRVTVRLWFRAQDRVLHQPLRLGPA